MLCQSGVRKGATILFSTLDGPDAILTLGIEAKSAKISQTFCIQIRYR